MHLIQEAKVEKAAEVAIKAVTGFLQSNPGTLKEVVFVLFDTRTLKEYQEALNEILGQRS